MYCYFPILSMLRLFQVPDICIQLPTRHLSMEVFNFTKIELSKTVRLISFSITKKYVLLTTITISLVFFFSLISRGLLCLNKYFICLEMLCQSLQFFKIQVWFECDLLKEAIYDFSLKPKSFF